MLFSTLAIEYTLTDIVKNSTQTIVFASVVLSNSNDEMVTGTITE